MKYFCLVINGENFLVKVDGVAEKHGFYQPFFIKAYSAEEAELTAVQELMDDPDLKKITLNSPDDPPTFTLEDIAEVDDFDDIDDLDPEGQWYLEDDEYDEYDDEYDDE